MGGAGFYSKRSKCKDGPHTARKIRGGGEEEEEQRTEFHGACECKGVRCWLSMLHDSLVPPTHYNEVMDLAVCRPCGCVEACALASSRGMPNLIPSPTASSTDGTFCKPAPRCDGAPRRRQARHGLQRAPVARTPIQHAALARGPETQKRVAPEGTRPPRSINLSTENHTLV